MTTEEILRVFDPECRGKITKPGMGRELKRGGFARVNGGKTVNIVGGPGPLRLWAVRNRDVLSNGTSHQALVNLYNKERGAPKAKF